MFSLEDKLNFTLTVSDKVFHSNEGICHDKQNVTDCFPMQRIVSPAQLHRAAGPLNNSDCS